MKKPKEKPTAFPTTGGSYTRDPVTGALTCVEKPPAAPKKKKKPADEADDTTPAADAGTAQGE